MTFGIKPWEIGSLRPDELFTQLIALERMNKPVERQTMGKKR
jgi:hypothetical protein